MRTYKTEYVVTCINYPTEGTGYPIQIRSEHISLSDAFREYNEIKRHFHETNLDEEILECYDAVILSVTVVRLAQSIDDFTARRMYHSRIRTERTNRQDNAPTSEKSAPDSQA